jgi:uncharacterized protein (TIGR03437 family)
MASQTAIATLPLPTVLGGTSVYINGQPAQLFAVTSGQANVLVPAGLSAGPATVTVLQRDDGGSDGFHDHRVFRAGAI